MQFICYLFGIGLVEVNLRIFHIIWLLFKLNHVITWTIAPENQFILNMFPKQAPDYIYFPTKILSLMTELLETLHVVDLIKRKNKPSNMKI